MKVIGLLGGMSRESTVPYYRCINEAVRSRLGGLHSARLVLYSVDFQTIEQLQNAGRWDQAGRLPGEAAVSLQRAGAECIVLFTNTMHIVAPAIEDAVSIPFLHIADATAAAVVRANISSSDCQERNSLWSRNSTQAACVVTLASKYSCRTRQTGTRSIA